MVMHRITYFLSRVAGRKKRRNRKVADAEKAAGGNDSGHKAKQAQFIHTTVAAAAGECEVKASPRVVRFVADDSDAVPVSARKGGVKEASESEFEFRGGEKPAGSDGEDGVVGAAAPDTDAVAADAAAAEATPKLKRSCSNIETKRRGAAAPAAEGMPRRSRSFGDLQQGGGLAADEVTTPRGAAAEGSPASVRTSRTADRVMLKKRSSSQVLPSRSRKLWWRLFLWSHRNLHRPRPAAAAARSPGRHGGYTSDTFEESPSPSTAAADRKNKQMMVDDYDDSPPGAVSKSQWVAFSAEHSLHDRVGAWVSSIEAAEPFGIAQEDENDDDDTDGGESAAARLRPLEAGESSSSGKTHGGRSKRHAAAAEDVVQANSIVQSLNAFSSVAHISGMGLKVVPMIAPFSSLRAVNLSGNFIVHISPGSLPKGLHSLDLSRNKIANIEGLRELTKLRVLNLSYNRISRIGHGLSSCTAIRELYLAGNKISDVEGLHRLLKLAVLDLGFNKLTTAKALGQLVANYHSLRALNLVGNPVQANVGDDALRRAATGLLPNLVYLNRQPVKPQQRGGAREATATDSVARAALGGGGGKQRRRAARRVAAGDGKSKGSGRHHHGSGSSSSRKN